MTRVASTIAIIVTTALPALADDWGMGAANRKIPQTNIFTTVSTPGDEVVTIALFVLAITGVIFVIVGGLLTRLASRKESSRSSGWWTAR